jgi:hypothetical protein
MMKTRMMETFPREERICRIQFQKSGVLQWLKIRIGFKGIRLLFETEMSSLRERFFSEACSLPPQRGPGQWLKEISAMTS